MKTPSSLASRGRPAPGRPVGGRVDAARAALRWLGIALIALAWMPALAASLLATLDRAGEHEVIARFTGRGFEVRLHHPRAAAPERHHHNLLETLLLGGPDRGEADHRVGFEWNDQLSEDDDPVDAGGPMPVIGRPVEPPAPVVAVTRREIPAHAGPYRRGPPTWRGVVMRL